jgi:hypothetical protein
MLEGFNAGFGFLVFEDIDVGIATIIINKEDEI